MIFSSSTLSWLPVLLALLILFIALGAVWFQRRQVRRLEAQIGHVQNRLQTVLQLNRQLVEASDEKALVEAALSAVNRLVGGLGVSFVPFDTWGQPLPAFTFGDLPEPVLKGWAEHLVSEQTRSRCQQCQELHALDGQACPLKTGPFGGAMSIYCLPLALGARALGMVNVYLPPERVLDTELHGFLLGLLDEMALAVDAVRLHNQELSTLRQIHRLRSPRSDLGASLQALLEGVYAVLGVEALQLQVRSMADERVSGLRVRVGEFGCLGEDFLLRCVEQALRTEENIVQSAAESGWISVPMVLPEGQVLGVLLAFTRDTPEISPRQWSVLHTAAAQAALMVEYERLNLSLEYSLVIQERTRLAREIHDGLAQTLAFLKMQTAQMQTAFHQGDTVRLSRLLIENRQALAEAYQETRQAIDNLRLSPDENLAVWVEQLAAAFEKSTGTAVVCQLQTGTLAFLPEISAQLVRIVQEALNNVRKHAHAGQVTINLREWGSDLLVEIIDDGQGFDPEDIPPVAQYGLRGMRERAELIGADFQIISQPRRGTTVRLALPISFEEPSQ